MALAALGSQNGRAFITTLGGALAYVGACGVVGRLGLLPARLSRKLMHIGTGPLFMLCWPLYTSAPSSRWLAAAVPALAGVQFGLVGLGAVGGPAAATLVAGASRSGRREELLRGPLLYAAVHVAATLAWWRYTPAAVVGLACLCFGDGLAEVVGRSCSDAAAAAGKQNGAGGLRHAVARALAAPLPHSRDKTVGGTLACWLGGAAAAQALLQHFQCRGMFAAALGGWPLLRGVLLCAAAGAAAESLPLGDVDNASVVLAAGLCARACFGF